jgi:predicted Zn-dependent protease with MMP-like domain
MHLRRREFEELVRQAVTALPEEFLRRMDNVDVLVRLWPTRSQLTANGLGPDETLLGLYEGIPLTDREGYNMVAPDIITIFQGPIEQACETSQEVVQQVRLFLQGHHHELTDQLTQQMKQAAQQFDYEQAAQLRDQVQAVSVEAERVRVKTPSRGPLT